MFSPRHSGSRGTETSSHFEAQRAISETVCSGSGTCSSTSIAVATSNSSSANGRFSAFMTTYCRHGCWRPFQASCSCGSSRSSPTMRSMPGVCAHWWVSTPSPQPTSSSVVGAAWAYSSSSVPSKRAISRLTTGLVEPYLSYVLPVTVPSSSTVTVGGVIA